MFRSFSEIEQMLLAKGLRKRLALANAQDLDALSAVVYAKKRGVIDGILIGDVDAIVKLLEQLGESPADYQLIPATEEIEAAQIAVKMVAEGRWINAKNAEAETVVTASVADYLMLNKTKPEGIELKTIEEVVAECL